MIYPTNCSQETLEEIHALGIKFQETLSPAQLRAQDQGGLTVRACAVRFAREQNFLDASDV